MTSRAGSHHGGVPASMAHHRERSTPRGAPRSVPGDSRGQPSPTVRCDYKSCRLLRGQPKLRFAVVLRQGLSEPLLDLAQTPRLRRHVLMMPSRHAQ